MAMVCSPWGCPLPCGHVVARGGSWPAGAEARASWFAMGARQVGCGALCALFGHRTSQTTAWWLPLCSSGAVKAAKIVPKAAAASQKHCDCPLHRLGVTVDTPHSVISSIITPQCNYTTRVVPVTPPSPTHPCPACSQRRRRRRDVSPLVAVHG